MKNRSTPRRILLVNNHASLGDLYPFVGMALALQAAGHQVTVGTSGVLKHRVEAAGVRAVCIGPSLDPSDPALMGDLVDALLDDRKGPLRLHRDYIFPSMEQCIDECLPHARESDLIVGGVMSYFVPTVAELCKVRWGRAILSPMLYWSGYDPPVLPGLPFLRSLRALGPRGYTLLYRLLFKLTDGWAKPLYRARKTRGLRRGPSVFAADGRNSPDLNLALFSRHFAAPKPDWPTPLAQPGFVRYDGPSLDGERIDPALDAFLSAGTPPILLTLGTGASVYRPGASYDDFARAIERMPEQRGLLLVGAHAVDEARARHASDRLFVAAFAPYGELMPRCAAVVHQGGIGTTARALTAGVPSVIVGHANDQLDNGRRVAEAGAGSVLPFRALDAESLEHALRRLLSDPTPRARAAKLGELLRAEDSDGALVQAIEACLARAL